MTGATSLPSNSIERFIAAVSSEAVLTWNVIREMPPRASPACCILAATFAGSPTKNAPSGPTEAWQYSDRGKIVTVRPQGRFKADNGAALIAAALAGVGIAWLPESLTHQHVASGALVSILTRFPPPPAALYVVRAPGPQPSRKVRVLTDMLIECFGQTEPPLEAASTIARTEPDF